MTLNNDIQTRLYEIEEEIALAKSEIESIENEVFSNSNDDVENFKTAMSLRSDCFYSLTRLNEEKSKLLSVSNADRLEELDSEIKDGTYYLESTLALSSSLDIDPTTQSYINSIVVRLETTLNSLKSRRNQLKNNSVIDTNNSISKFTITPLKHITNNVLAVATVTFYDTLTVNSITIREAQSGNLYVKMPQKLTLQGNYIDVIHPLSSEVRKSINETLINAFNNGTLSQKISYSDTPKISARNSVKYEIGKYGNNLARLDVIVNDMVVHNCKIINSKDNKPLLTLPTYKDKNGVYHSIMTPTSPERFKLLNQAALNEYNTEYSFKKCDEAQLSAIKESGIKCSSNKNAQGDIFVKFKTSDLQKVNSVLSSVAPIHK